MEIQNHVVQMVFVIINSSNLYTMFNTKSTKYKLLIYFVFAEIYPTYVKSLADEVIYKD